ncbi:MAG: hypothetical protein KY468_19070 [Armatimonadetes bacterium]|nr:hypothetical protein [Armatimonadota bacterium]
MPIPKKILKPNDREVVAQAQFRTGAGVMKDKRRDPKHRRREDRLEEKRALAQPEE